MFLLVGYTNTFINFFSKRKHVLFIIDIDLNVITYFMYIIDVYKVCVCVCVTYVTITFVIGPKVHFFSV